jgi:protein TonB
LSDTSPQTHPTSAYFELPPERRLPAWRLALFVLAVLGVHLAGLFLAFGMVGRHTPAAALPALTVRVLELAPVPPRREQPIKVAAPAKTAEVPAAVAPPKPAEPPKKRRRPKPARVLTAPAKKVAPTPPLLTAVATAPATTSFAVAPQAPSTAQEAAPAPPPAPPLPMVGARFDADYLHNPRPVYPAASRRLGEEGRVILRVRVSAQGLPLAVDIKQSSGFARLDEAARAAVERWRFVPARQGHEAVESSVLVPLQFTLDS